MVWHTHHCGDSVSEGGRDGKEGGRKSGSRKKDGRESWSKTVLAQ